MLNNYLAKLIPAEMQPYITDNVLSNLGLVMLSFLVSLLYLAVLIVITVFLTHWCLSLLTDCVACGQCESVCPQHITIIENLKTIAGHIG